MRDDAGPSAQALPQDLTDRADVIAALAKAFPNAPADDAGQAPFCGSRKEALERLAQVDAAAYGRTRNHLDGAVTRLSPYIRHGFISLAEARDVALDQAAEKGWPQDRIQKFVQELAWRDYWRRVYADIGASVWDDLEPYKTGWRPEDYADELPADIAAGDTGVDFVDAAAKELRETGYLHNHMRMWIAAYVVHFRRVRWQAGAAWFLTYLLDGDPASNNLSWQWVASTFAHKPYYFNSANLKKNSADRFDGSNARTGENVFAASYEMLADQLFPHMAGEGWRAHQGRGEGKPKRSGGKRKWHQ